MDENFTSEETKISEYNFLANKPVGEDLFNNQSQEKISTVISDKIINDSNFKIIGIDGTWGSGKSNLVKLIENKLSKSHKFFIYDVWGHQEDDQRHSILTEITDFISNYENDLVKDKTKWKDRLKVLISKQRNITTTNIPHLSIGFIISLLLIIYIPTVNTFAKDLNFYWKIPLVLLPILVLFGLFLYYYFRIREGNKKNNHNNLKRFPRFKKYGLEASQQLFKIYNNHKVDETKIEIISEKEPTVKEFREWMDEIDKDLKTKIVIVFDNFDRLPKKHILNIWSSIHIFFAEKEYKNIKVILPFDREHVQNAFKDLNSGSNDKTTFADDYVNKTFDIVFRISLPIMSDWKQFFREQWKQAFGRVDEFELEKVIQVYEFLNRRITPREIIAFINEILTIKHLDENLKERYIAIFILCKDHILSDALKAIIDLSYLNGLKTSYSNDEEYAKQITSIVYHIPIDEALELIYTEQLKQALNKKDFEQFTNICNTDFINDIFFSVINDIEELSNPILTLEKISPDSKVSDHKLDEAWETFYDKILNKDVQSSKMEVEDWGLALLKKAKDNRYLEKLLQHYRFMINNFDISEYINVLDVLFEGLEKEDVLNCLKSINISPEKILKIVNLKREDYLDYKCSCNDGELDEYLKNIPIDDLLKIDYTSILTSNFNLPKYKEVLSSKLKEFADQNNIQNSDKIITKLKETVRENGDIKDCLSDVQIYSLYVNHYQHQPKLSAINELITMRIARGGAFRSSYASHFETILNSNKQELAEEISKTILNYIEYGDLLLLADTFKKSLLYKNIVRKLINNNDINKNANIYQLIDNYKIIKISLEIEDNSLLVELDDWDVDFNEIEIENLDDEFIKDCFENKDLDLSKGFINKFNEFKDYDEEIYQTIFENEEDIHFKYFNKLEDSSLNQVSLNAFKTLFIKTLKEKESINSIWRDIFNKYEKNNTTLSIQNLLKDIRDNVLNSSIDFNIEKALYLIPYFLKYNLLDGSQDIFRKILKVDFLSNVDYLNLLLENSEKVKGLYKSAKNDDKSDFRNTVNDKREENNSFEKLAKELDIRKPNIKKNDVENS